MKRGRQERIAAPARRVTTPHEAVRPLSWAERRARFRDPRVQEQPARGRLVQRTLAQTGHPAPVGQRRASMPLPRRRAGASMPVKRRQRRSNWRFWRRLFSFLAVLAVVSAGVIFALTSSTFHVQQVHISGTHNAGLIAAIQHMGIQGQDIFLLNSSSLTVRLEALPLVATASLVIQLPNSVTVSIQERTPVLLWQSGRTTFGIARDGVVIAPLSQLSGGHALAMIVDKRQGVNVRPGTRFSVAQVAFAQQLWRQLPGIVGVGTFTLQYVDRIAVDGRSVPANQAGAGSYVVVSSNGWLAYMGDAVNSNSLENRLLELQQILSMAQQQRMQLATIDLRFGFHPTYTLK